jgi:hypothetical protein
MESERKAAAAKEAGARRALGPQILRERRATGQNLERSAGSSHADAVLADDRRRDHREALAPLGALLSVPFIIRHSARISAR